jgi:hypothetical protein
MRTLGAKDLKRRHRRKDIGKKRKKYAGKKTKPRRNINGRFVPHVSKRRRDDPIHIGFYRVTPMTHEGLMNFSGDTRRKMHRFTYGTKLHFITDPSEINTKEKIADFVRQHLWGGVWQLRIPGNSKNKYHCSYRAFAVVKITEHSEGLKVKVIPSFKRRSLRRLWWWMGD